LQRLPLENRWDIAAELVRHGDDAEDANLPLMDWYAIEPLVPADPGRALTIALHAEIPLVRQFIARRVVDAAVVKGEKADLSPLVAALTLADAKAIPDLLRGAREGLRGRKSLPMPAGWPPVYAKLGASDDTQVRENAVVLALVFGDPQALADLREVAVDAAAPPADRIAAVEALVDKRVKDFAPVLHRLLGDRATRRTALRGLAAYADAATPKAILAIYSKLAAEEKADAVATLASRKDYALALLDAVEKKRVPRGDVTAYAARQIFALGDAKVAKRLEEVWGTVREANPNKQSQIERFKAMLTPQAIRSADAATGRALFAKSCQQCHKLYGEGGAIGPDLTGSNRTDVDYLLLNLVDPSAEVGRDFRMSVVRTADGRVITGIVVERTPARVVVQSATDRLTLSPDDVESVRDSPLSIMPEGQLDALTRQQVRDLFAYLTGKGQVALPGP
jgi:putative heme-binding domain-containing protein